MRVAIADDHRVVREGLRWMLGTESEVEIVAEARSGSELISALDAGLDVDVVLLDLRMPDMSGFEVLDELSRANRDVRFVVLSAHDDPGYVRKALDLGASGYLLKNVGQAELVRALKLCAKGETYVQGDLTRRLLDADPESESSNSVLTTREQELLQMIADGSANKQIASALDLSEATVKWYLKNIFAKLETSSRAEAVAEALRRGLIS